MIKKWAFLLNMKAQTVIALRYLCRGSTRSAIAHFGSELAESQGLDWKQSPEPAWLGDFAQTFLGSPSRSLRNIPVGDIWREGNVITSKRCRPVLFQSARE